MMLRTGPMLGFKRSKAAAVTIAGIEPRLRIRNGQFGRGLLHLGIDVRLLSGVQS